MDLKTSLLGIIYGSLLIIIFILFVRFILYITTHKIGVGN